MTAARRTGRVVAGAAIAVLAVLWLTGNVRPVPVGNQAAVLQFGRVVSVQASGLVLAWPWPVDTVRLLPGPALQLPQRIDPAPATLTGDGGAVSLQATVAWRISDPASYAAAPNQAAATIAKLFAAAATQAVAARRLDDVVAAPPALADAVAADINRRLAALAATGAPLGVAVRRVVLRAIPPPGADCSADRPPDPQRLLAAARADAAATRARAARERAADLIAAQAAARENIAGARARVATIAALEQNPVPGLLDQVYRARIGGILNRAGTMTTVDAKAVSRVIVPGAAP